MWTLLPASLSPVECCRLHGVLGTLDRASAEVESWHLTVSRPEAASSWVTDYREGVQRKGGAWAPLGLGEEGAAGPEGTKLTCHALIHLFFVGTTKISRCGHVGWATQMQA